MTNQTASPYDALALRPADDGAGTEYYTATDAETPRTRGTMIASARDIDSVLGGRATERVLREALVDAARRVYESEVAELNALEAAPAPAAAPAVKVAAAPAAPVEPEPVVVEAPVVEVPAKPEVAAEAPVADEPAAAVVEPEPTPVVKRKPRASAKAAQAPAETKPEAEEATAAQDPAELVEPAPAAAAPAPVVATPAQSMDEVWTAMADAVVAFQAEHDRLPKLSAETAEEKQMGLWLTNQKARLGSGILPAERVAYLNSVLPAVVAAKNKPLPSTVSPDTEPTHVPERVSELAQEPVVVPEPAPVDEPDTRVWVVGDGPDDF